MCSITFVIQFPYNFLRRITLSALFLIGGKRRVSIIPTWTCTYLSIEDTTNDTKTQLLDILDINISAITGLKNSMGWRSLFPTRAHA